MEASSSSFFSAICFDAQLNDASLEPIERLGLGIDLHADARGGLIDQVDGFIGQLAIGDVAVRKRRRGDDGRIGDLDAVMHLIAFLQAAQNRDGVFHARLIHQHGLEAPLERGILLDVLAIFIERGRADAVQLAARERGLEHVAGIHRAFGPSRTDDGVQLVDEQDHLPFLLGELVEHALQALLEFAAKFGAGHQRRHVEREDALVLQPLGHLAVDDALRESLDDRGLADAGLADQHRIVLGAPLQHLDRAADLIVAPDHRIELAAARALGQIDRVFLEGLALLFGGRIVDALAAAHVLDRFLDRRARRARFTQRAPEGAAVFEGRQHEQLAGDVLIVALLRQLVGDIQQPRQVVGDLHVAGDALNLRQPVHDA